MEGRNDLPNNKGDAATFPKKGHEEGSREKNEADIKVGESAFHNVTNGKKGHGIVGTSRYAEHDGVGGSSCQGCYEHRKLRAQLHDFRNDESHGYD